MEFLLQSEELEAADSIDVMRARIDAVDDAIIQLIIARTRLSVHIQAARISGGEPRIVLSRERAIRGRYRAALGAPGDGVADAVLRVCRGNG
ncbi:MAG TPA: chorismate mutase [Jatrophihabitans sp.]|jgi:chorismate mutase|uniref:chorismate mutase n=1 Tax=Jatrophihabitans sp. TaxID=1932789 RepID=UPI002EF09CAE